MKLKVKVQVGVNIPGVGVTKKNKEFEVEGDSLETTLQAVAVKYRELKLQEPHEYAAWQISVALPAPAAEAPAAE